jgi:hypothetical protein
MHPMDGAVGHMPLRGPSHSEPPACYPSVGHSPLQHSAASQAKISDRPNAVADRCAAVRQELTFTRCRAGFPGASFASYESSTCSGVGREAILTLFDVDSATRRMSWVQNGERGRENGELTGEKEEGAIQVIIAASSVPTSAMCNATTPEALTF